MHTVNSQNLSVNYTLETQCRRTTAECHSPALAASEIMSHLYTNSTDKMLLDLNTNESSDSQGERESLEYELGNFINTVCS